MSNRIKEEYNLVRKFISLIYFHARSTYPEECCGMIFQSRIKKCQNVEKEATKAFMFSFEDQLFLSNSFDSNDPVRIIYHSHPDVGAYFSKKDEKGALLEGKPVYPVSHLIVDVQKEWIGGAKLFTFLENQFREIARFEAAEI